MTLVLTKRMRLRSGHGRIHLHPKTLIEMWITCLDPVSANSEKGRDSEWAVRVGQRLPRTLGTGRHGDRL